MTYSLTTHSYVSELGMRTGQALHGVEAQAGVLHHDCPAQLPGSYATLLPRYVLRFPLPNHRVRRSSALHTAHVHNVTQHACRIRFPPCVDADHNTRPSNCQLSVTQRIHGMFSHTHATRKFRPDPSTAHLELREIHINALHLERKLMPGCQDRPHLHSQGTLPSVRHYVIPTPPVYRLSQAILCEPPLRSRNQ